MRIKYFIIIALLCAFLFSSASYAQDEEITLTTYYPAPYGDYEEITTRSLTVVDGNEDTNKILSSDESGNATWKSTAELGLGGSGTIIAYGCDEALRHINASSGNITDDNVSTSITLSKGQHVKVAISGTIKGDFYSTIVSTAGDVTKVTTVGNNHGCTTTSGWNPFYIVTIWRANEDTTAIFKQRFYKSDRTGRGSVSGRTIMAEIVTIQP
jgi:hypothetical protein